MNRGFPYRISSWTGVKIYVKKGLICFDYNDYDNDLEGESTGDCNATPNGFSLYVPKFYMNSIQG